MRHETNSLCWGTPVHSYPHQGKPLALVHPSTLLGIKSNSPELSEGSEIAGIIIMWFFWNEYTYFGTNKQELLCKMTSFVLLNYVLQVISFLSCRIMPKQVECTGVYTLLHTEYIQKSGRKGTYAAAVPRCQWRRHGTMSNLCCMQHRPPGGTQFTLHP
jgi:hypothetical protein